MSTLHCSFTCLTKSRASSPYPRSSHVTRANLRIWLWYAASPAHSAFFPASCLQIISLVNVTMSVPLGHALQTYGSNFWYHESDSSGHIEMTCRRANSTQASEYVQPLAKILLS